MFDNLETTNVITNSNDEEVTIPPWYNSIAEIAAILDMSKHIIYDFYYNVIKTTFDNVELLG